ncbi:MAG: Fic family protein [Verrucomicrobiia bacterium]
MIKQKPDLIQKATADANVQRVVSFANERYSHWERFKYYQMPAGYTAPEVWSYIKLQRILSFKDSPVTDQSGAPFRYWLPDCLLKKLNEIDRWSGEIIGTERADSLPQKSEYIISSLMEEAIASSQLEGAATTRTVAKAMLREGRKPTDNHERMILNNWRMMQHLLDHRERVLTPDILCDMHRIITEGTLDNPDDAGRIRTRDDVHVYYNDEIVHTPPPSSELKVRIERLCKFASSDDDTPWVPPVLKAIMLHFWLAYDHPFVDGNGRTARTLFYWYLLSRRYWIFEYLAISRYIIRAPAQYERAFLYSEKDENDFTYFLVYNLRAIGLAFRDLREYLGRKQQELKLANSFLKGYRGLNHRQKHLIYHALQNPDSMYTIQTHKNTQGIAYDTARADLMGLQRKRFFRREQEGKEYVFIPVREMVARLQHATPMEKTVFAPAKTPLGFMR